MQGVMTETASRQFGHLPAFAASLGLVFARPKAIAMACVVVLAGLGWFYLAFLAAPGGTFDGTWAGGLQALCQAFPGETWRGSTFAITASMWSAMTLAMMLPSAAPMILTYAEIAETASHKGEPIVSPLVIAAGYAGVWLSFSVAAAVAQLALTGTALLDPGVAAASGLFSAAIFIVAGVYQFSRLKHACLTHCQQPFPFFFVNWATTPRGVFRLGVRQGLYCLGCCWAMMLVMFAVGIMNVAWMAGLAIVMTVEKLQSGRRFTYVVGVTLIAAGAVGAVAAIAAHWPGQSG
jgi:predicted metal-binding membrane protein